MVTKYNTCNFNVLTVVHTESVLLHELEFTVSMEAAINVQFRWVQHDTLASPAWAVDDIIIDCPQRILKISFEEVSR